MGGPILGGGMTVKSLLIGLISGPRCADTILHAPDRGEKMVQSGGRGGRVQCEGVWTSTIGPKRDDNIMSRRAATLLK